MRGPTTMGATGCVIALLASGCGSAEEKASSGARGFGSQAAASAIAGEASQTRQLLAIADDPKTVDDKLFLLWEYAGALRERELAKAVLGKAVDPEIRALAVLVRDGHQAGIEAMDTIAEELGIFPPGGPTRTELAAIEAASALPPAGLETFFLRRI